MQYASIDLAIGQGDEQAEEQVGPDANKLLLGQAAAHARWVAGGRRIDVVDHADAALLGGQEDPAAEAAEHHDCVVSVPDVFLDGDDVGLDLVDQTQVSMAAWKIASWLEACWLFEMLTIYRKSKWRVCTQGCAVQAAAPTEA